MTLRQRQNMIIMMAKAVNQGDNKHTEGANEHVDDQRKVRRDFQKHSDQSRILFTNNSVGTW